MRLVWIVCLALLAPVLLPVAAMASEEDVIAEAERLYKARGNSDSALEGLEALRDGAESYPQSYGIHWRLARACWWIAEGASDTELKKTLGKEGMEAGEKAVSIKSSGIEGHYWTTLALGEYANGISIIKAIAGGLDGKFTDHLDIVLDADEDYDNGGALRARSRYHFGLPRLMRSYPKALERAERANELVPNHIRTLYYLAETEHVMDNDEKAREYLDEALALTDYWDGPERVRVMAWCKAMDKEIP